MKLSCEKASLLSAISVTSRATASKSTIPSLEGILIEAYEELLLSGYNLRTGIRSKVEAEITETGSIVLNSRLFSEIVRSFPDDVITITSNEKYIVTLECGMSKFEIIGSSAEDYPELPSIDGRDFFTTKQSTLKSMISQTIFAISDNESRPIHTGSLFELEDKTLTIVSVDGYRLALRKEEIESSEMENGSFVVPGSALLEIEKIMSDTDKLVKITLGTKHISFVVDDTELISRRLEGEFLNYRQAIPQNSKYIIEVNKRDIISSVERVSLIISDKLKSPVRCLFDNGVLYLSTVTTLGKANDECMVDGDGEKLEIGFNNKYLLDALKAAPSDSLKLMLTTGISPCIIVPSDDTDKFIYMVLPVRLKAGEF